MITRYVNTASTAGGNGVAQNIGVDYTCTNSTTVSWNGYGLDGTIAAGDEVRLMYPA